MDTGVEVKSQKQDQAKQELRGNGEMSAACALSVVILGTGFLCWWLSGAPNCGAIGFIFAALGGFYFFPLVMAARSLAARKDWP